MNLNIDLNSLMIISSVTLCTTCATIFLKSYLGRKADNLATKEDLAALTRPVEEIKLEFKLQEERARAALGIQLAAHRVLFEHEFEVYRDLWKKVLEVKDRLHDYESLALEAARLGLADQVAGCREVSDAAKELNAFAESHKPFFVPEVSAALFMMSASLQLIAAESSILNSISENEIKELITKNLEEIGSRQRLLEEAIRGRLYPDLWRAPVISPKLDATKQI